MIIAYYDYKIINMYIITIYDYVFTESNHFSFNY